MNFNIDWGFSLSVVFTGLVVVFVVLLLLVGFCILSGKIFTSLDNKKKSKAELEIIGGSDGPTAIFLASKETAPPEAEPEVEEGISDETVAAISAAISVIMTNEGNNQPFAVKSIKRTKDARPAWKTAGIQENTTVLM